MPSFRFQLFPPPNAEPALSPDAFQAPQFFVYPSAGWWRDANPSPEQVRTPSFPTRARYWREQPLERLRSTVPLRGESRARAKQRAARARAFTSKLFAFDREHGTARYRIILTSAIEAVTSARSGSQQVWQGDTKTPFQTLRRGERVTDAVIDALYYDLVRATVRISTGIGKGPSGAPTDARHGPDWYDKLNVNRDLRRELNDAGITYENSVAYADVIVLEVVRGA